MCEILLNNILNENIKLDIIIKWLKNDNLQVEELNKISVYDCTQDEFILYFLNFLHEATSGILQSFPNHMTPSRRTVRNVENLSNQRSKNSFKKSTPIRTSLFTDEKNKKFDSTNCLGVSSLEVENKQSSYLNHSTSTPKFNKSRLSNEFSLVTDSENSYRDSLQFLNTISPIYHKNRNDSIDTKNKHTLPKTCSRIDSSSFCLGDFMVNKSVNKQKRLKSKTASKENITDNIDSSSNLLTLENSKNVDRSFETSLNLSDSNKNIKINSSRSSANKRRINPTNIINLSQNGSLKKRVNPNNSFSFQKLPEVDASAEESRNILREECLKISSRSNLTENNCVSEVVPIRSSRSTNICLIQPNLDSITHKNQLDTLVDIYSLLLDLNLVLNILSELYFLFALMLTQIEVQTDKTNDNNEIEDLRLTLKNNLRDLSSNNNSLKFNNGIFNSVHNCVYFAAKVLSKQYHLLSTLDRPSLKLLQENMRLKLFAPELAKHLTTCHGQKLEKKSEIINTNYGENISFVSETDNRENFPNDSSFHTFRKQRDLFYELLQNWQTNHLQPGWNFSIALANRIRGLVSMHLDPVNLMHLARLFKSQLLSDCMQLLPDDNMSLPSCFPIQAEKLTLLKSRMVSSKRTGGPSPEPSFPDRQEFYQEFIRVCESPKFHRHLIDCFTAEIIQLNANTLWSCDVEEKNSVMNSTIKSSYLNALKSLKVLAKFLGYLDAFPYRTENVYTPEINATQILIRGNFIPSININDYLNEALQFGKLILTVPWLIDYLAMLDHVTLRLPQFAGFIEILFEIHFNPKQYFKYPVHLEQILMIKLCLGWLFERSNFPLESYQNWISKKYQRTEPKQLIPIAKITTCNNRLNLDSFNFIDETILFTCCPYLSEILNILNSDPSSNFNNKSGFVKYIRPISYVGENSDIMKNRLQKQLQDAFLHSQPSSTRKTLDLVVERVFSASAKYILNNLIPSSKLEALKCFQEHLEHVSNLNDDDLQNAFTDCCIKKSKEISEIHVQKLKTSSKEEIAGYIKQRCVNSLKALLADDVHVIAKDTLISIAIEQCNEKIQQWCCSYVSINIFLKELFTEMENIKQHAGQNSKKISYKLPSKGKNVNHDPDVPSPVVFIIDIREKMYKIHEKSDEVKMEDLLLLIENSSKSCESRCDLNPVAQFTACRLFFDTFFMLAFKRPDIAIEDALITCLINFWTKFLDKKEKDHFFDRIFCPRNVGMFEQSCDPKKTWAACEKFIIELFKTKLLTTKQFETQTIAMFRYDWDSGTMKHFCNCLQNVVDDYVRKHGAQEDFTYILSWLANFCGDDFY